MAPDDLDPLDQRERYWQQRHELDEAIQGATAALADEKILEADRLFSQAIAIEQALPPLAAAVGIPNRNISTHHALTQALAEKRAALAHDDSHDTIGLTALFKRLIDLEQKLFGSDQATRNALLATLDERMKRAQSVGDLAQAQATAEAMGEYDIQGSSGYQRALVAILIDRSAQARRQGQIDEAETIFLEPGRVALDNLSNTQPIDQGLRALNQRFERERIALRDALAARRDAHKRRQTRIIIAVAGIVVLLFLLALIVFIYQMLRAQAF